jgi:hypothetical protein
MQETNGETNRHKERLETRKNAHTRQRLVAQQLSFDSMRTLTKTLCLHKQKPFGATYKLPQQLRVG